MKKLILLLLFPVMVLADLPYNPRFSWTPPSQWSNEEPLDPAEIAEYRLYCTPGIDTQIITNITAPFEWTAPQDLFLPGSYACHMTAVAVSARGGGESAPSDSVNFDIIPNVPGPVIIFTVQ